MADTTDKIRKGRKYDQVLEGARNVFMADGFEGASVDDIARSAGVSKATLYSYFADKRQLFAEVARVECLRQSVMATSNIDTSAPAKIVLAEAAKHLTQFLLSEFAQSIFRVCVGESDRFPEQGREFYKSGPEIGKKAVAEYLVKAVAKGELVIDDIDLAAHQFSALCKTEVFDKRVFGVQERFSEAEIDRIIDGAVDMFMARYGA